MTRAEPRSEGAETPKPHRPPGDARALAASLAEPLRDACGGRLGSIIWFRTDWQRGGAATGHAPWSGDDCEEAVVKLPVNTRELAWLRRVNERAAVDGTAPVVPRLLAGGTSLADYELAWVVIERLPHGPLGCHWHDDHIARIAEASAKFAAASAAHPVDRPVGTEPWPRLLAAARASVESNALRERSRWNAALRTVAGRLDAIVQEWEARTPIEWIHGDLHLANAMSRVAIDEGPVCLIDLAEVRPGHWVEDAIYLERQLWAIPERLKATRPVRAIAHARKQLGLSNGPSHMRMAAIRRLLLAATAPAFMKSEGAPAYLNACLERLEITLKTI